MVLAEDWMRRVRFLPLCTFELLDSLHHRISSLFSPAFLFGRSQPLDENVGQTIFLHGSAPVKKTLIFRKSPSVGLFLLPAFVALSVGWALTQNVPSAPDLKVEYSVFQNPPTEFRGHAWLDFRLGNISDDIVNTMVDQAIHSNSYGGFMITSTGARPGDPSNVVYLSDEYFRLYRLAIERGLKGNLPLDVLYDEQQFPTGMAGGQFAAKYPQLVAKSLEKVERDVTGPAKVELQAPIANGIYIGAVRMNLDTLDCVNISDKRLPGRTAIDCRVSSGRWKVMLFYLDPALRRGLCDYLDPQAVDKLIEIMYQAYYDHLKEFFGTVIKMSFYDEPALHHTNGRHWTPGFNQAFQARYGFSPMKYYPALWYEIGPETAAARNALFGFRAELYAENFFGRIAAWCGVHGIAMSGHVDQEETRNPVGVQGDLIKVFKHQQIPGVDDIWWAGRSNVSYKLVSSAAYNFDRPLMMAETYAAYLPGQTTPKIAYRTAMDQHAMGVNLQIGSRPSNDDLQMGANMGAYVGRMEYLLRHGRHVADIAVLYPIAALQADFNFAQPVKVEPPAPGVRGGGEPNFYYALEGGVLAPENDYMELGEVLYRGMRLDFTYLHPEVMDSKCAVEGARLVLNNRENREEFPVIIVPGSSTIPVATARKLLDFYKSGGTIIATRRLPTKSAEFKKDREVQQIIGEIFGVPAYGPMTAAIRAYTDDFKTFFAHANALGGKAFFVPQPEPKILDGILKEAVPVRDVDIQQPPVWPVKMNRAYEGALTYIHKIKDGRDIYFFANSSDNPVDADVVLRGKKNLAIWNPHTGERSKAQVSISENAGQPATRVRLVLPAVTSVFFVEEN